INKQINRVIAMFKWAAKKEFCSGTVPPQLKTLGGLKKGRTRARETAGISCVADKIIDKTLVQLPEIVADMVRFQRLTGTRPGEVCSIRPCDIDRSKKVWIYEPDSHKTEHHEKGRIVPVGPKAQKILLPYLLRRSESFCFSPKESVERARRKQEAGRKTPRSCGNRRGTNRVPSPKNPPSDRYKVSSYRTAIRRACDKLEMEVWTPNQLRHTAATQIRKEFGVEAAQVICGHETADVTQVYAERDLELAIKVAEAVG
ncbi:MAG: site-specific integrase, partial [Bdellovibrionales bacterium]|nr:site-specific integrase [Bdellovibrionales bacterium]